MFVATYCEPEEGKAIKDIVAQPDLATLIDGPPHVAAGATPSDVALMLARDCVEPTSYRAALTKTQTPKWQIAMQHDCHSLMDNGTWDFIDLFVDRTVVNSMWIYNINSDT
jgi:hypothetical protein